MTISSITLRFSNPSMGPHETVTEYECAAQSHQPEVDKLVEGSSVNTTVGLSEYLAARRRLSDNPSPEDQSLVQRVESEGPDLSKLPSGGTIEQLTIAFEDGQVVTFGRFSGLVLSGSFREFRTFILENGRKRVSSPGMPEAPPIVRKSPTKPPGL